MENYLNNISLLRLILKFKIHLGIILISSIALSVLFSSPTFIKPKYKSEAIIYPSNLIAYSQESSSEQMMQILNSEEIKDSLVKKFDLANHYRIDKDQPYYYSVLSKEFESNVSITKTEYESVRIVIKDEDPKIACNMVKAMMNYFNLKVRMLQREKAKEVLVITSKQLELKTKQIDTIETQLNEIRRKYDILDYDTQTKELYRNYYKANSSNKQTINSALINLKEKGGDYQLLNEMLLSEIELMGKIKLDYENALRDANKNLTYINTITYPIPADKKSYPIRWLIVLSSTIASLVLSLFILLAVENYKENKKLFSEEKNK